MTAKRTIAVVLGTRPEAIKLAPVVLELRASERLQPFVIATAQHREMLDQVLDLFRIIPDVDLDLSRPLQTLEALTGRCLTALTEAFRARRPDLVIVQGDTTTAFAASLAAFYENIPVAHVEAGLRTGDNRAPFPEEVNRRMISVLAALHLAPTESNRRNLLAENAKPAEIVVTGNTAIDALHWALAQTAPISDAALEPLRTCARRLVVVTAHRREAWGAPLAGIAEAVADIARDEPDILIIFPVHRNPVVRDIVMPALEGVPNVRLLEPLGYLDFARLMTWSYLILTDSGGVQEEAPSLGKPVLVLRDATERPEAVEYGTVRLVGTDRATIHAATISLLRDHGAYDAMAHAVNPYGDGQAARRIVAAVAHLLREGPPADEFSVPIS
jgi:UDP-N-acetylglucosamine 2-epimerase (non-hydrolysing)